MTKKNICILFGGKSGEHEVSIRSASSVVQELDESKYNKILIAIDKTGRWFFQPEAENILKQKGCLDIKTKKENIVSLIPSDGFYVSGKKLDIDFVFPVLHGTFGEDGTVQGLLELMELPYAGAGVLGSSVGMDKEIIKKIWLHEGLATVPFASLNTEQIEDNEFKLDDFIKTIEEDFGYPLFIKPVRAGSSVGISKVENKEQFNKAIPKAFKFDNKLMIEPAVDAREIECSVIGNMSAKAYAPGEIAPTHSFYDYEAKYIDENGAALIIPADIDEVLKEKVKETAVKAYTSAGVEGMARVDFFLDKQTGKLLLNEVNTIPGFTNISMFSKLCEADGLPYSRMLDKLIELGEKRFTTRSELDFNL
ncbi:MAG: D-alanine--D-alanine ligase [Spirochaetales bacterium]|nr:D-alanine--D-alanine ligase [Spirochaetales bacterium]